MRKTVLILTVFLLIVLIKTTAFASGDPTEYESSNFTYILLEDDTVEITGYTGEKREIIIPSELDSRIVTSIGDDAFNRCNLTSITIPDNVIHIGSNPFYDNMKLFEIVIPSSHPSLEVIDGVLFDKKNNKLIYCPEALQKNSYSVPQGTKIIGNKAFYHCDTLEEIFIPEGVSVIGEAAFSNCFKLKSISIPKGVTVIENYTFFSSGLKNVLIPEGVTFIGRGAFMDCLDLTEVTIPDGVESIGNSAFCGCINLQCINIPDTVASIGDYVFDGCKQLKDLYVSSTHPVLLVVDGVLFDNIEKELICYPCGFLGEKYDVPEGIISIRNGAFLGCNLVQVLLPEGVLSVGYYAFAECEQLTNIVLPDSITFIGENAFSDCELLTLTVGRDTYSYQYCVDNELFFNYPDSNDWLLD